MSVPSNSPRRWELPPLRNHDFAPSYLVTRLFFHDATTAKLDNVLESAASGDDETAAAGGGSVTLRRRPGSRQIRASELQVGLPPLDGRLGS